MKIPRCLCPFALILTGLTLSVANSVFAAPIGEFDHATDVGKVSLPGSATFDAAAGQYRISGSGANIWYQADAFQFLYKKLSGNLSLTMDVALLGESKEGHRKACAMVRQGLDADDIYVDVAVHGDGMIALQYRKTKGGDSFSIHTPILAPATVKIEREGDVFTVSIAKNSGAFQSIGEFSLALANPVYVGLGVSAHSDAVLETAVISKVVLRN